MRAPTTTITALALLALAATTATAATDTAPPMLGGWAKADVTPENSQTLLDALTGGNAAYRASVGKTRVCFTDITRVETQVVAGTNYRFYINGCSVSSTKRAGKCVTHKKTSACAQPVQYVVEVFEQNWTDTLEVTSISKDESDVTVAANTAALQAEAESDDDSTEMPESEKRQVDAWIASHDLNEYGDPKHTMYTGGTPLFDESTGESIDRYEYIVRRHPDRPWQVQATVRANVLAAAAVESATSNNVVAHKQQPAQGLMSVIVSVGVLTVLLALVAGVKAKRTRRHFAYDSVTNREI